MVLGAACTMHHAPKFNKIRQPNNAIQTVSCGLKSNPMPLSTYPDAVWLDAFIRQGLNEDIQSGDITSLACVPAQKRSKAVLKVKDYGVLAGMEVAKRIFELEDPSAIFTPLIVDGTAISEGDIAFEVEALTQVVLRVERLLLNSMQRMSGIATLANRFSFEVEDLSVTLLDTRKTTPLLRPLEKWAVRLGGCQNYRIGLYDRFMIKDNHVEAAGGMSEAIQGVLDYQMANDLGHLDITVEVRNLVELNEALIIGGFDRIMLDNFEPALLRLAVEIVDNEYETEASGGIHIGNVREYAKTGVQFISVGALTHSFISLDLSLKIVD
jgi:nicotinate-nucleotide pyrophosphorylase (carboxylating)